MQRLKKTVDMTEGPFLKKMVVFAIPILISGLLQCFYNAADLIVVGQFEGDIAVAAVGSTGSLTSLCLALFLGLSVGSGVCVSHHVGADEPGEARKVLHTSVILSALLSVVIAILGFILSPYLLSAMGTPENVHPHATLYLRIIFLGVPGSMLYNYLAAIMRAAGDSKRPLIFLSISGLANVGLNLVLVTAFDMGVEGVAIATIFSQYLSAGMALVYLARSEGNIGFSFKELKFNVQKMRKILYVGVPSGIQSALFSLSNVLIQSSINSFGEDVVAGSAAANNIDAFMYFAMNAMYHVTLTFVGQNVGAKKFKNIRRITAYAAIIVVAIGVVSGALVWIFRYPLLRLYVSSDASLAAALERFVVILTTYYLCGLMEVFIGTLRALDRSITAMIISLTGACGLRILWIETMVYIFPYPMTIYVSYPVTWFVTCVVELIVIAVVLRKLVGEHKRERNKLLKI